MLRVVKVIVLGIGICSCCHSCHCCFLYVAAISVIADGDNIVFVEINGANNFFFYHKETV